MSYDAIELLLFRSKQRVHLTSINKKVSRAVPTKKITRFKFHSIAIATASVNQIISINDTRQRIVNLLLNGEVFDKWLLGASGLREHRGNHPGQSPCL